MELNKAVRVSCLVIQSDAELLAQATSLMYAEILTLFYLHLINLDGESINI